MYLFKKKSHTERYGIKNNNTFNNLVSGLPKLRDAYLKVFNINF
jgi:hypothetical protein